MRASWSRLRAIPTATVAAVLGVDWDNPQCPLCGLRFEVAEAPAFSGDPARGASVRCTSPNCRVGRLGWQWPVYALAEIKGLDLDNAERRLLDSGREREQKEVRRSRHEAAVAGFTAALARFQAASIR